MIKGAEDIKKMIDEGCSPEGVRELDEFLKRSPIRTIMEEFPKLRDTDYRKPFGLILTSLGKYGDERGLTGEELYLRVSLDYLTEYGPIDPKNVEDEEPKKESYFPKIE